MPIYEYECTKCGEHIEAIQKFSDKPLKKCNSCTGKLQKLISQSAFHLKGSGWYVTDYAGKSGTASENSLKKEEKTAKKPEKKENTSSKSSE